MGNLQRLVFELIFIEIKKEMHKAEQRDRTFFDLDYDDPDMAPEERAALRKAKSAVCLNDNYCFEMLCMILDLTSARSGQQFIASRFVKEIAQLGGDISSFVSTNVHDRVKQKIDAR